MDYVSSGDTELDLTTDQTETPTTADTASTSVAELTSNPSTTLHVLTQTDRRSPMEEEGDAMYTTMAIIGGCVVLIIIIVLVLFIQRGRRQTRRNIQTLKQTRQRRMSNELSEHDQTVTPIGINGVSNTTYSIPVIQSPGTIISMEREQDPLYINSNSNSYTGPSTHGGRGASTVKQPVRKVSDGSGRTNNEITLDSMQQSAKFNNNGAEAAKQATLESSYDVPKTPKACVRSRSNESPMTPSLKLEKSIPTTSHTYLYDRPKAAVSSVDIQNRPPTQHGTAGKDKVRTLDDYDRPRPSSPTSPIEMYDKPRQQLYKVAKHPTIQCSGPDRNEGSYSLAESHNCRSLPSLINQTDDVNTNLASRLKPTPSPNQASYENCNNLKRPTGKFVTSDRSTVTKKEKPMKLPKPKIRSKTHIGITYGELACNKDYSNESNGYHGNASTAKCTSSSSVSKPRGPMPSNKPKVVKQSNSLAIRANNGSDDRNPVGYVNAQQLGVGRTVSDGDDVYDVPLSSPSRIVASAASNTSGKGNQTIKDSKTHTNKQVLEGLYQNSSSTQSQVDAAVINDVYDTPSSARKLTTTQDKVTGKSKAPGGSNITPHKQLRESTSYEDPEVIRSLRICNTADAESDEDYIVPVIDSTYTPMDLGGHELTEDDTYYTAMACIQGDKQHMLQTPERRVSDKGVAPPSPCMSPSPCRQVDKSRYVNFADESNYQNFFPHQ